VSLTEAGRLLQTEARRLLQQADDLQARMRLMASGEGGRLALAFTSSAAAHAFVPRTLRACRQRHPQISLELSEMNAIEITEAVQSGRLHCGLLRVPVADPEGLAFEVLFREPVVVAVPVDHPLAPAPGQAPRALDIGELRDDGFILVRRPNAPGLYANLLALCEARGFRPRVVAEVSRMMTNLNLVAAGAGVSVVPASMCGLQPRAVAYCPLADPAGLDAPMTLVWRRAEQAGPTATFIELARAMARQPL
jgi:DNA-binding transcriptional LysR family regulator